MTTQEIRIGIQIANETANEERIRQLVNAPLSTEEMIFSKDNPIRIQRSRKHKQVSPNGLPIVYVGRPGKWGNPYKLTEYSPEAAIEWYKWHIAQPGLIEQAKKELKGKNLSCWCALDQPCHADILLKLVNS